MNLDETKLTLTYYPTANVQYLFDSFDHPEYLENELIYQFGEPESTLWYKSVLNKTRELIDEFRVNLDTAAHLGCSTGRLVFDLTKIFQHVRLMLDQFQCFSVNS